LELVIVDYLQLLQSPDHRRARHEEVGAISRSLKLLARELEIPVVVMCQLNRAAENKDRPQLQHLRESGAIEADADTVLALHKTKLDSPEMEVLILKNRGGPGGTVMIFHEAEYYRLTNAAHCPPAPEYQHWADR
jgi:replicative DNA helicase